MNPQAANNPFLQTLQRLQQGGQQQGAGQQQAPNPLLQHSVAQPAGGPLSGQNAQVQANMPPGMSGSGTGTKAPVIENSSNPGQSPGSTQSLVKVLQNLSSVISDSSDPKEIQMIRQIILMVQELIKMDQAKQSQTESALGQAMSQSQNSVPPQLQGETPSGANLSGTGMQH